jgi:hypothetical protein
MTVSTLPPFPMIGQPSFVQSTFARNTSRPGCDAALRPDFGTDLNKRKFFLCCT